jgi:serine phosphatase RsbU (regulator of sigma subunit)
MALFRSLIRIFSGQTALQGLNCHITVAPETEDPTTTDPNVRASHHAALEAVRLTNAYIVKNHEELAMFATLFFGVLNPATGELSYINSGHDPPVILDETGRVKKRLAPTGPAVGIQAAAQMDMGRTTMAPGDLLFGFTDGVTEAQMAGGEFFGEKRLVQRLGTGAGSAAALLKDISAVLVEHIGEAEQFDDITMLAVRRLP